MSLKVFQHFPPRLADARGFGGTGATNSQFGAMPIREVLGLNLLRQAIPYLFDEIAAITHTQTVDAKRIDPDSRGLSPSRGDNFQRLPQLVQHTFCKSPVRARPSRA